MEKQKEITINKDKYIVSFHTLGYEYERTELKNYSNKKTELWICAYVILKGKEPKEYMELGYCTYKNGDIYGIDTNHYHNWEMTLEEKYEDAIKQIKEVIRDFRKLQKVRTT